jgi:hypothetical protein
VVPAVRGQALVIGPSTRMPHLWTCIARRWFRLSPELSWVWWRALLLSPWSACAAWRDGLLDFEQRPLHQQGVEDVARFLQQIPPRQILGIVDDLGRQGLLLPRDKRRIETAILALVRADGLWK